MYRLVEQACMGDWLLRMHMHMGCCMRTDEEVEDGDEDDGLREQVGQLHNAHSGRIRLHRVHARRALPAPHHGLMRMIQGQWLDTASTQNLRKG